MSSTATHGRALPGLRVSRQLVVQSGALLAFAAAFAGSIYLGRPVLFVAAAFGLVALVALLLHPLWALSLSFALMPLEAVGRVVPSQPALTWAKVVLVVAFAGVAVRTLVGGDKLRFPPYTWALFGFVGAGFAGSLLGGFTVVGLTWKFAAAFLFNAVFVILAFHLIRTEEDLAHVALAVAAGSVPVVVFAVIEVITKESVFPNPLLQERLWATGTVNVFRITSTFYDPNALGRYLVFAMLWTLGCLGVARLRRWRAPLLALVAVQSFCVLNTFSRGAFLAIGAVGLPFLVSAIVRKWHARGLVALVVLAAVLVAVTAPTVGIILDRFDDPTAGGRLEIYEHAYPALERSPLVGYGREHVPDAIASVSGQRVDAHNLYIETLLSVGIVGFLFVTAWVAPLIREMAREWRSGNRYARVVLLPLLGVLVFGLSLHGMDGYELWIPLALALPAKRVLHTNDRGEHACEWRY